MTADIATSLFRGISVNIYVGNLAFGTTDHDLRPLFEQYGSVDRIRIIIDRDTGRSKGFGFVEMADNRAAQSAIAGLQGKELEGRTLTVNKAKPREPVVNRADPAGKSHACRRLPSGVAVAGVGGVSRRREARPNRTPPWVCAVAQRRTSLSVSQLVSLHSLPRRCAEERSAHQGRYACACGRLRSRAARHGAGAASRVRRGHTPFTEEKHGMAVRLFVGTSRMM